MKRLCALPLILVFVLALTGCYESVTVLTVEADGSGKLVVRDVFSPRVVDMVTGMRRLAAEERGAVDARDGAAPETRQMLLAAMAQERAELFGESVSLAGVTMCSNQQGWIGYLATYTFADVRGVRIKPGEIRLDDGSNPLEIENAFVPTYTFDFASGGANTLKIISTAAESGEAAPTRRKVAQPVLAGTVTDVATTAETMAPALKGMRQILLVNVGGKILLSDAAYQSAKRPNIVTILDMNYEEILKEPAALDALARGLTSPAAVADAVATVPRGVIMEQPGKTVTIVFGAE